MNHCSTDSPSPGELCIAGLGPGSAGLLTPDALAAITGADVVAGYAAYVSLISPALLEGKEVIATGMMGEVARCEQALDAAAAGKRVCLVCSGDPGVYAMAGLVMEILHARNLSVTEIPVTIVPGVPAVCAAAALLGAPLTHDFACVSLSDLLTPWETIVNRLEHAFAADFVVALYNPRSKKRADHLAQALAVAAKHRASETPLGHVRNAYRDEQSVSLHTVATFSPKEADMFSIILIGNSSTRFLPGGGQWEAGKRMYTPRGYGDKYAL
ncbi:MAG: putative cobalt-factor III C(17)-methyltransferase [Desulfovibrio sp.]